MVHEKTGFGWPDLWKRLHLVQIWLAGRPGPVRTPFGPGSASPCTLQMATYALSRRNVLPVVHMLFSWCLQDSAAPRPKGAPQEVDFSKIWLSFSPTGSGARQYAPDKQPG